MIQFDSTLEQFNYQNNAQYIKAWDCFILLLNFPSMCFLLERQLPILSNHILRGRAEFHITKNFMMS